MEVNHNTLRFFWSRNNVGHKPDQTKECYVGLDACWLWSGNLAPDGYGKAKVGEKHMAAHRLSWTIHNGPIPEGKVVMHRCDNRACVNPSHLKLGTTQENTADSVKKGRRKPAIGAQLPHSKLNETSVRAIRDAARRGVPHARIAETFGICQQAVSNVVARKTWKHVA